MIKPSRRFLLWALVVVSLAAFSFLGLLYVLEAMLLLEFYYPVS